jgi:hypothetical protein
MTISNPCPGARVFTKSGKSGIAVRIEGDRIVVRTPEALKSIPLDVVVRWEPPVQRYKLKGTQKIYTLVETHEVNVCGTIETWGKFLDSTGLLCYWAMHQIVPTTEGEAPGVDGLRRRLELLYCKPDRHPLSYGLCSCGKPFEMPGRDHSLCTACGWVKSE